MRKPLFFILICSVVIGVTSCISPKIIAVYDDVAYTNYQEYKVSEITSPYDKIKLYSLGNDKYGLYCSSNADFFADFSLDRLESMVIIDKDALSTLADTLPRLINVEQTQSNYALNDYKITYGNNIFILQAQKEKTVFYRVYFNGVVRDVTKAELEKFCNTIKRI